MTAKIKAGFFFLFPILVLFLSLLFPRESIDGVRQGAALGAGPLIALFPSLTLSRMMMHTQPQALGGRKLLFFTFFVGILCGFPIGASLLASLVQKGKITKKSAEKMLFFTGSASPAFLISYCGRSLYGREAIGWFFFFLQGGLSLLAFLFFLRKGASFPKKQKEDSHGTPLPFFEALALSLKESALTYLHLVSCVIFFSFVSGLICHIAGAKGVISALICSFFELSKGVSEIAALPLKISLPLCGLALGWNGLSVHFQTLGVLQEEKIGVRYYFGGKVAFSLILCNIPYFLQKVL